MRGQASVVFGRLSQLPRVSRAGSCLGTRRAPVPALCGGPTTVFSVWVGLSLNLLHS